eukprot:scaffold50373_cov70-Phaeocystis_antarctica.AAC.5
MSVSSCSRRHTFSSICPPSLAISSSHSPLKIVPPLSSTPKVRPPFSCSGHILHESSPPSGQKLSSGSPELRTLYAATESGLRELGLHWALAVRRALYDAAASSVATVALGVHEQEGGDVVLRCERGALEQLLHDRLRDLGQRGHRVEGHVHHHAQRVVPRRLVLCEDHLAHDVLLLLPQLLHQIVSLIHRLFGFRLPRLHLRVPLLKAVDRLDMLVHGAAILVDLLPPRNQALEPVAQLHLGGNP